MHRFNRIARPSLFSLLIMICLLCVLALAQGHNLPGHPTPALPGAEQQMLQTILSEVQQTRITVQRSMTIIYRVQTLLSEARLQGEQIGLLQKELDQLRAEALQAQSESLRQNERLRDVTTQISSESNSQQLETLRIEENEIRLLIQENLQSEALRQERESQINNKLRGGQVRLVELNRQITVLERELPVLDKSERSQR